MTIMCSLSTERHFSRAWKVLLKGSYSKRRETKLIAFLLSQCMLSHLATDYVIIIKILFTHRLKHTRPLSLGWQKSPAPELKCNKGCWSLSWWMLLFFLIQVIFVINLLVIRSNLRWIISNYSCFFIPACNKYLRSPKYVWNIFLCDWM